MVIHLPPSPDGQHRLRMPGNYRASWLYCPECFPPYVPDTTNGASSATQYLISALPLPTTCFFRLLRGDKGLIIDFSPPRADFVVGLRRNRPYANTIYSLLDR